MSASHASVSACPACAAAPAAEALAETMPGGDHLISLPGIHCAMCISGVEKGLQAMPGVRSARVNLTLKRATVDTEAGVETAALLARLHDLGFEAYELDKGQLTQGGADKQARDLLMRMGVAGFGMMNVMLEHGRADHAGDRARSGHVAIRDDDVGASRLFRRRDHAVLLPAGWAVSRPPHTRLGASAAQELAALEVPRALRVTAAGEETVAAAELAVGDIVRVKPGGRIPVDGIVTEGQSELDRSLMTGESLPAYAGPGTAVSAGEVNLTGPLMVEVRAAGRDTSLHRIADLVAVAESGRANYNSLADQAAKLYAPGVHILAVLAAAGWWIYTQDLRISLNIAAAVLIITCPCALGLAVPAVTTAASGRLFRKGLLIKDGTALERLAETDTVVFDKTGTLTGRYGTGHGAGNRIGPSLGAGPVARGKRHGADRQFRHGPDRGAGLRG
jgi:Cu2+-exporting ATPase